MIEVVLLCHLLALALNIPHLGCDRPSDPDLLHPSVPGAHSDKNYVCTIVVYYILPLLVTNVVCSKPHSLYTVCYIFGAQSSLLSLCGVTFLVPNKGLEGLGWHG